MYCLDSSVVIDILRGDTTLRDKLQGEETFCITPLVLAELFKGAYLAERQQDALKLVEDFAHSVEIVDFSESACKIFGQKFVELKKLGKNTQEIDLMIGCIAAAHGVMLVTRNPKHFANIRGLKIEVW